MAYQQGSVTIDENFARFGSKSYAINKITSVDVRKEEKFAKGWFILAIIAFILIISGLGSATKGENWTALVFGILFVIPVALLYRKRISRTYFLMLTTAGGEVQATKTYDENAIIDLRDAIEREMARSA